MHDIAEDWSAPEDFSGAVRLFPLPDVVLLPHAWLPLHIFEPRYRELVAEALAGDLLIAMALLSPGWEPNYERRPPIEPIVCVGRIVSHKRLADGRYNLMLRGTARARLIRELAPDRAFRTAEVELLADHYPPEGNARRETLRQELIAQVRRLLPTNEQFREPLEEFSSSRISLGALSDILAFCLDFPVAFKQRLLRECNVDERARSLIEQVQESLAAGSPDSASASLWRRQTFPPEFSEN